MSGPLGSAQWMYASGAEEGQSLRFEDGSSAYLSRTPASAGNRKTWTWSAWVKRGNLTNYHSFFSGYSSSTALDYIFFNNNDTLSFRNYNGTTYDLATNAVFRDVSAWYHIVLSVDTTQATSSNRIKLYVNGELQSLGTATYPSQNYDFLVNSTVSHYIGQNGYNYFDGYLSDVYFIDGQALDPTSFGETIDGYWRPVAYSGSYGTNGFHLEFDGAVTDSSGNGNDWTANNISAHDYVPDSPTNNFAVLNSLDTSAIVGGLSEGNLKHTGSSSNARVSHSTFFVSTGKYYYEGYVNSKLSDTNRIGFGESDGASSRQSLGYRADGQKVVDGSVTAYGDSYTNGDVIGCAVDADNNTVEFFKNGVSQGQLSYTKSYDYITAQIADGSSSLSFVATANFGQDSTFAGATTAGGNTDANGVGDFKYPVPTGGYLALCSANLPQPTIVDGSTVFSTALYSGSNSAQSITGIGFEPSLVWLKNRNYGPGIEHVWTDAVRGATKRIESNTPDSEATNANDLQSFDADGFTVGGGQVRTSASGYNYAAWNWKAGTSFSNSAGTNDATIDSSGSANSDFGFSIVSWTGNATSGAKIFHGLSQTPEMILVKNRTDATNWGAGHKDIGWTKYLTFSTTSGEGTSSLAWDNTAPTSSVITLGSGNSFNGSTDAMIAYCFHSSDLIKVGSYTGNNNVDGPFCWCGFRPAWIMIKKSTAGTTGSWLVYDSIRSTYNPADIFFYANEADDEYSGSRDIDFLSNGFKIRNTAVNLNNTNDFVFLAFAETPFKFATAR